MVPKVMDLSEIETDILLASRKTLMEDEARGMPLTDALFEDVEDELRRREVPGPWIRDPEKPAR